MATVMAGSSRGSVGGYSNYLKQEEKTEITLIETKECTPEFARDFETTKNLYNKTKGVQFHEIVQSFSPGEVTPEQAHEIGKRMLESEKLKDFQAVVITHIDRDHIHNHIVINSVSHVTGEKYHQTPQELKQIKELSNELCKARNLSYLNLENRGERYINNKEKMILKTGEISKKQELREWIKEANIKTQSLEDMKDYLKKNYDVDTKIQNKNIKFKHPKLEKFMNGKRLGADYEKWELERGIFKSEIEKAERGNTIEYPRTREQSEYISRNDNEINRTNIISKNEYIGGGADESGKYTTQADTQQLYAKLSEIRGINKEFDIDEQRRIKERDTKLKADLERTKSRDRPKAEELEKCERRTIPKSKGYDIDR